MSTETPAFETQMVDILDVWKSNNNAMQSAMGFTLDPGSCAVEVFGDNLDSASLFLYLFRRFGAPVDPIDDFKQCAEYSFTTPRPDLWLGVSITPTNDTRMLFRYTITADLAGCLQDEARALVVAWHAEKDRWCREQGMDLPELPPLPTKETCKTEEEWDAALLALMDAREKHKDTLDEAFKLYTSAHPEKLDELHNACGPLKKECHQALLAALRDLKRATWCRDMYFNPHGRLTDADIDFDEESETSFALGRPVAAYADPFDHRLVTLRVKVHQLKLKCGETVPKGCAIYDGNYKNISRCPKCNAENEDDGLTYGFANDLWTKTACQACGTTYYAIERGNSFVLSSLTEAQEEVPF
ncbi:hypothetical protein LJC15_00060 [Desulfovibrio sp. OttesenSCG-928-G11]|nr:hypothetical protein [Desulfovibrio sp. OttesenSCG-928-G11]